ncbi:UPF0158 family protein [Salibacterium halotolerans]|uniref:Uncharacterized protein family (UPF0158) n=1 Tax=Salibacterium halotolerans TaxID=1884432 RepID=A0A1I5XZK9_9BACI|nr:UPF0158 family protein [Salibacterium halotolerans]SFQ37369.1 Uncharacterised protein family (UPF0158) [Salibacterium halotolerans]
MTRPANLHELVDEVSVSVEGFKAFLNRKTGGVVTATEDDLREAEMLDPDAVYTDEVRQTAVNIEYDDDDVYLELPDDREVDEYGMMEEFILTLSDSKQREELELAIRGKGAFRRFKDKAAEFGVEKEWYAFRDRSQLEVVREWCERHGIPYTE